MTDTILRVLVLEDSFRDMEIIAGQLSETGYRIDITHVTDERGYRVALSNSQFDVILADYNLPGYDAFRALELSMKVCPWVPFICVSGSIGEDTAIDLLKLGAVDYVLKDRPERLPFSVKRALSEANEKAAHQKAAGDLKESEERFSQVAEIAQEWIWEVDCDGLYTYASPVIKSLLGYAPEEMIGKRHFYDSFIPEKREELKNAAYEVFCNGDVFRNFENANIHKDGRIVILATSGGPVYEADGTLKGYRGVDADITSRKRAEEALKESEEKFRRLFHDHSAIKLIIDPENGDIVEANQAAANFYGWPVEDLKMMKIFQINALPAVDLQREIEKAQTRRSTHFEFRHRVAGGGLRDVEVFSSAVNIGGKNYLHSIIHDITEKKKAEESIKLLDKAIQSSSVSVIITDSEGRIIYTNPFFSQITGYSSGEVVGRNLRFLKSGYQKSDFYKVMWDTILAGNEWEGEFRNKKKNGELYWERAVISPIMNIDGAVTHFVAIKEDITEKKRMLEELVRSKEKAEESDRLKTAFLNNISHEIRTPMNAIIGFAALLAEPGLDDESKNIYIQTINQGSSQLLAIITDIIDISNIEAGIVRLSSDKIYVGDFLKRITDQFALTAKEKGIEIKSVLPPGDDSYVVTDNTRLTQIISNLVNNAFKFTSAGAIEVGYRTMDEWIEIYVSDTGIGIPADQLDRIFERFYQVDNELSRLREGTGLGLSLSKGYAVLLGGTIRVESEPGKGSVFTLSLPRPEAAVRDTLNGTKAANVRFSRPYSILVVEDDEMNASLLQSYLSGLGLEVTTVSSGGEAIDFCRSGIPIDLVLMDLGMSGIDGYEATAKIKEILPELPIIAQTAYASPVDSENAFCAGCNDFLTKPFRRETLLSKMKKYLP